MPGLGNVAVGGGLEHALYGHAVLNDEGADHADEDGDDERGQRRDAPDGEGHQHDGRQGEEERAVEVG